PTQLHHAVAGDLLEAGVDVLVEKPLTTTVAEGKALVELAVRRERVLQVGHLERFNPAIRALDGVLRNPRFIECHRLAPFSERGTDVDVVLDLMIHDLDVILSMMPSALRSVEAVGVPVLTTSVDIANARLRFANGGIANVTASRVSLKRERKLRIFQPDAYLSVDYGERRVLICRREPGPDEQPALSLEEREVPEADALGRHGDGGRRGRGGDRRRDGGGRAAAGARPRLSRPGAQAAHRAAGPLRADRLPGVQPPAGPRREAGRRAGALLHRAAGLGLAARARAQDRAPRRSTGGRVPLRAGALRGPPARRRVRRPSAPRPRGGDAQPRGDARRPWPRS